MKTLEFETSKGKFLIKEYDTFNDLVKDANFYKQKICKLSEITEEQASGIVDNKPSIIYDDGSISLHYRNYLYHDIQAAHIWKSSAISSLHSLLKSKGIHLFENPHPRRYIMAMTDKGIVDTTEKLYLEAEEKTFYNPYIFKICTKQQS